MSFSTNTVTNTHVSNIVSKYWMILHHTFWWIIKLLLNSLPLLLDYTWRSRRIVVEVDIKSSYPKENMIRAQILQPPNTLRLHASFMCYPFLIMVVLHPLVLSNGLQVKKLQQLHKIWGRPLHQITWVPISYTISVWPDPYYSPQWPGKCWVSLSGL